MASQILIVWPNMIGICLSLRTFMPDGCRCRLALSNHEDNIELTNSLGGLGIARTIHLEGRRLEESAMVFYKRTDNFAYSSQLVTLCHSLYSWRETEACVGCSSLLFEYHASVKARGNGDYLVAELSNNWSKCQVLEVKRPSFLATSTPTWLYGLHEQLLVSCHWYPYLV